MTSRAGLSTLSSSLGGPASGAGDGLAGVIALHLLLFLVGVLLGVHGALQVPRGPRVGGSVLSTGLLIGVVGNIAAPRLGRALAGRYGGIAPVSGWLVAALAMGTTRPAGSVVLPGGGDLAVPALLFLLLGSLVGVAAAATGPRRRRR